jgi:putative endopeptidase
MSQIGRALGPLTIAALLSISAMASGVEPSAATAPLVGHGLDVGGIDRTATPGDDFFRYADGAWLKATQIPPDRSSYGTGAMLSELSTQRVADLLRDTAANPAPAASEARKVGDYYATFMDEEGIERKGLTPLQPALQRVDAISDRHALARALGATLRADVDILNNTSLYTSNLFGLWIAQDLDDPHHYSPFLVQGGLGMPDRDYYLSPSPHMAEIRAKYQAHIAAVLKLANVPDAESKAARIFDLEHRMAEVHWSRAESEDVLKGNNHWSRKDFDARAPGLDWQAFFAAAAFEHQARFVVWQSSALTGLSALTASQPLETWKDYLRFHTIQHAATYLPNAFVNEQFAFYGTVLSGTPQLRPRWKRAVDTTNEGLGDAVGKLYVQRYFLPAEKARAEAMVRNLLAAFTTRIDKLDWMAPQTKIRAKAKLAVLKVYVGYPDTWRDYSALKVVRGDALGNAERAELFEYHRNVAKLGRAVDRSEWVLTPQTVNAVNLPAMNAINFPAAILQPPFFDPKREWVMDYGAIGATIGHEISHSFDDQGALFDDAGRLNNWWTKEDFAHFQAAATRLVDQYNDYRPFPDLAVNGKQTLSENIADVAGLSAAYDAYRLSLNGTEAPAASGFEGDQLFFLSFAQSWRNKMREPALRQRIVTDGHAPGEYRADTVRNLDAWYVAFDVKPGQKLYLGPTDRVRIW